MCEARIYVGTYGKYNDGNLAGAWLDLADYADKADFLEACAKLHADEHDPEFMFPDFEGFPRSMYCESSVSDELFDWVALDDDDKELLAVYRDHVDSDADLDAARDAFLGKYDSPEDWAASWLDDTGMLAEVPESLRGYIDFEAYARDAGFNGMSFIRHDGVVWVFDAR